MTESLTESEFLEMLDALLEDAGVSASLRSTEEVSHQGATNRTWVVETELGSRYVFRVYRWPYEAEEPDLQELEQASQSDAPSPTDPTLLAKISAPVLLLHGSETAGGDFYSEGLRHVVEHVADVRVREIEGAGHFGVAFEPERIAEEVTRFFKTVSPAS